MSRRRKAEKREIAPDAVYQDELISKFINILMKGGKKSTASRVLYEAMDLVGSRETEASSLEVVKTAVENIKPSVEVKSRRVGGANYQVPIEVRPERRQTLSIRWLIQHASARNGKSMRDKLAAELLDAFNRRGGAMRKKDEVHRMAESNKAFAHYRW